MSSHFMRLPKIGIVDFVVLTFTLSVPVLVLEFVVRVFHPIERRIEVSCTTLHCGKSESWYGYFSPQYESFFYHADGAWRLRRNKIARVYNWNSGEEIAEYRTNSLGFRDSEPNPEAQVRILAIGDSLTFGQELSEAETWPYLLEQALGKDASGVEVMNAGVPSNGFAAYEVAVREQLQKLKPSIVVIGAVLNDMSQCCSLRMYSPPPILSHSMAASHFFTQYSILRSKSDPIHLAEHSPEKQRTQWSTEIKDYLNTLPEEKRAFADVIKRNTWMYASSWSETAWNLAGEKLNAIYSSVRAHNATLVIIQFPLREQVELKVIDTYPQQQLAHISHRLGVHYIDLLPPLRQAQKEKNAAGESLFIDPLHLNPRGNAIVAEALYRKFRQIAGVDRTPAN